MAATITDVLHLLEGVKPGAWVAISEKENRVMAVGIEARAVLKEAQSKGESHPLIVRVSPNENSAMFL